MLSKEKLKEESARLAALAKRASDAVVEAEKDAEPHADKLLARIIAWPHSGLIVSAILAYAFLLGMLLAWRL